jgi:alkylation response protein AidB-like acyl-CoA dehydrogenase
MADYRAALERVIDEIVLPDAPAVDADGAFPRRSLDALGEAGILGLTVAEPFGGGGNLGDAVEVVRGLAGACGSTAMVVLMHYAGAAVLDRYGDDGVRKAIFVGRAINGMALL